MTEKTPIIFSQLLMKFSMKTSKLNKLQATLINQTRILSRRATRNKKLSNSLQIFCQRLHWLRNRYPNQLFPTTMFLPRCRFDHSYQVGKLRHMATIVLDAGGGATGLTSATVDDHIGEHSHHANRIEDRNWIKLNKLQMNSNLD